jgi:hypothetical protein
MKENKFKRTSKKSINFKTGNITLTPKSMRKVIVRELEAVGGFPVDNEQIRIVTMKRINSFDFILGILEKHENIDELIIAFYRLNNKVTTELAELKKSNKIKEIQLLINDGFPKMVSNVWRRLKSLEKEGVLKIGIINNHTKIILAKAGKNYYVVEGSGNLSNNARIEQYVWDNNKDLYYFHKEWILKFI